MWANWGIEKSAANEACFPENKIKNSPFLPIWAKNMQCAGAQRKLFVNYETLWRHASTTLIEYNFDDVEHKRTPQSFTNFFAL